MSIVPRHTRADENKHSISENNDSNGNRDGRDRRRNAIDGEVGGEGLRNHEGARRTSRTPGNQRGEDRECGDEDSPG
jgi:hypothetical protein